MRDDIFDLQLKQKQALTIIANTMTHLNTITFIISNALKAHTVTTHNAHPQLSHSKTLYLPEHQPSQESLSLLPFLGSASLSPSFPFSRACRSCPSPRCPLCPDTSSCPSGTISHQTQGAGLRKEQAALTPDPEGFIFFT